jgi:hypothetical protein
MHAEQALFRAISPISGLVPYREFSLRIDEPLHCL